VHGVTPVTSLVLCASRPCSLQLRYNQSIPSTPHATGQVQPVFIFCNIFVLLAWTSTAVNQYDAYMLNQTETLL